MPKRILEQSYDTIRVCNHIESNLALFFFQFISSVVWNLSLEWVVGLKG